MTRKGRSNNGIEFQIVSYKTFSGIDKIAIHCTKRTELLAMPIFYFPLTKKLLIICSDEFECHHNIPLSLLISAYNNKCVLKCIKCSMM